jgi:hypothetical protein
MTSLNLCEKLLINWQQVAPEKDKEQANVFINILKSYKGLEQQYRIVLEAVKLLHLYAYKHPPSMSRVVFDRWELNKKEYEKQSSEDKAKIWKTLMLEPEIKKYFDQVEANESENISNVLFLEHMIKTMTEAHDEVNLPKVLEVYNLYPAVIGGWKKKLYGKAKADQHKRSEDEGVGGLSSGYSTTGGWAL